MKKILALVLALCMVFALCACGQKAAVPATETAAEPAAETAAEPAAEPAAEAIVLKMGDNQPANSIQGATDDLFAKLVEEKSEGRIKIDLYHDAQLGEEEEMIQQLQFGSLDLAQISLSPLCEFAPEMDVLQLPYLYDNADHMWAVLGGEIGDSYLAAPAASGITGLAWVDGGARNFYTTEKELTCAADLKGLKLRVQSSQLMMDMVSAFDAVPQAMSYGDVYSALQTGVIDGAENNWPSFIDSGHYELCKYYIVDGHTRVPDLIVASTSCLEALSEEDQAIIRAAAKEAQEDHRVRWAEEEAAAEAKALEAGIIVCYPDDISDFQEAVQSLYTAGSMADYADAIAAIRALA